MLILSCSSLYCLLRIDFEKDYWLIKACCETTYKPYIFGITESSGKCFKVYVCVCIYIYIYIHIHIFLSIYIYIDIDIDILIYIDIDIYRYILIYI